MNQERHEPHYAFIKVIDDSTTNITTSFTNILDEDLYESDKAPAISDSTDGISLTSSTGVININKGGVYHITVSVTYHNSANGQLDWAIFVNGNVNSGATGKIGVWTGAVPMERTFQVMLELTAGDKINVEMKNASGNLRIWKGTTVVINKIASENYHCSTVTTTATTFCGGLPHNPYEVGGHGIAMKTKVHKGITVDTAAGRPTATVGTFTITQKGKYVFSACSFYSGASSENIIMDIKVMQNGVAVLTVSPRVPTTVDPNEYTNFIILDCEVGDNIGMENNWVGLDASASGTKLQGGSSLVIYRLLDDSLRRENDLNDSYISVVATAASATMAAGSAKNIFKAGNFGSPSFTTSASNNISFFPDTGEFKILEQSDVLSGVYMVNSSALVASSHATVDIPQLTGSILVNGVEKIATYPKVEGTVDPSERTISGLLTLAPGDVVTVTHNNTTQAGKVMPGTSFALYRIAAISRRTSAINSLIGEDNVINTYSPDSANEQYISTVTTNGGGILKQAPFSLGVRGPMSLRGRGTTHNNLQTDLVIAVKLGDKKV
mgnify:CR=1 FL=1|tara:strand:+ start:152 stop:1807 length:1656 start_codon:yes stop_codon:yes gene_type:complete